MRKIKIQVMFVVVILDVRGGSGNEVLVVALEILKLVFQGHIEDDKN